MTDADAPEIDPLDAIAFLLEAATYFERRPTGGEDAAHWSNIANAANCRKSAALVSRLWQQPPVATSRQSQEDRRG